MSYPQGERWIRYPRERLSQETGLAVLHSFLTGRLGVTGCSYGLMRGADGVSPGESR